MLSWLGVPLLPAAIVGVVLWTSSDMRDTTHRFFAHIRNHRDGDAYAMASGNLRSSVAAPAFPAYLDTNARAVRASTGEWINGFSAGWDSACMDIWMTHEGSIGETVYVILVKENGQWRVETVTENEPEACDDD